MLVNPAVQALDVVSLHHSASYLGFTKLLKRDGRLQERGEGPTALSPAPVALFLADVIAVGLTACRLSRPPPIRPEDDCDRFISGKQGPWRGGVNGGE